MTADEDKLARAKKVAEHVRRAAEELTAAADELPVCDCAVLDEEHMAQVVHDLGKAERAVINVHSGLRLLEQKHEGGPVGLATLESGRAGCKRVHRRAVLLIAQL
ncbi:hypothetical protein ACK3TF_000979 [Chlorella vulgaris]